ncbi:MAG TPA: Xaa-Pro peptidase family protein [Tepidisphaeraceae bacterium]|jgi:Xaa-Pro dipeptidase
MTRLQPLLDAARTKGLDAVALVPGTNLRYITGMQYHAGERLTVAVFGVDGRCGFVLPEMEAARTKAESPVPFALYSWSDEQSPRLAMDRLVADLGLRGKTVAVEHGAMRVFELLALQQAGVGQTPDATPILFDLRVVKDASELDAMRRAVEMIERSLDALLGKIRPGLTERQVASMWLAEVLGQGAEGPAFDFIVASGPNAASPHHGTGDRTLQAGDLVILDGGARHAGYNSDITRTVAIGQPSELSRRVYDAVLAANAAARAAARPGLSGRDLDAVARKVIEDAGFGPQFIHRTGHGLGMDVHEAPNIASYNPDPLPIGSVFTIEPGVYLAGQTGVRIEDDVVLTEGGGESLTSFRRELIVV